MTGGAGRGTTSVINTAATVRAALETLGLKKLPASRRELKACFVKLAKQSHPDTKTRNSERHTATSACTPAHVGGSAKLPVAADMADLRDSYKALAALYTKDTGELTQDARFLVAGMAHSNGASMSRHAFHIELDETVMPHRATPAEVGAVWLPWLKAKPKSVDRAEEATLAASPWGRVTLALRAVGNDAAAWSRKAAADAKAAVQFIVSGV